MSRILQINDSEDFRVLLRYYILSEHDDFDVVDYVPKTRGLPSKNFPWIKYDLILLDYDLGLDRENGLGWLNRFNSIPDIPPIIMTTAANMKIAITAIKPGAIDYIDKKNLSAETLNTMLDNVLSHSNKQRTLIENKPHIKQQRSDATIVQTKPLPDLLFQDENEDIKEDTFFITEQLKKFGLTVPGYELLKEIGRGSMSVVLLAKPLEEDKQVVLKIMFTKGNKNSLALKLFMQEYTLISSLEHPHIVTIYERAFASDFAYIAMENFPGGDLTKKLLEGIGLETAIEYARQICMGLVALHDINIVHRDIKPGNILFRADGTLVITDFGVAKNLSDDLQNIAIDNNTIIGTPYYISPEQATGVPIDHRSDLYSLGIMIYQMLTNKYPYTSKSVFELISQHLFAPIPRLPEDLAEYQPLIDGLLAKDPDERFQSANDVILGLDWIK